MSLAGRRQLVAQPPRIAVLLQLIDYLVSNTEAFLFGQTFA
jgi:hypothetical protein